MSRDLVRRRTSRTLIYIHAVLAVQSGIRTAVGRRAVAKRASADVIALAIRALRLRC